MFSKPRHGRESDPSWSMIVVAILVGLIVARAVSTGAVRRVVTGLLGRAGRGVPSRQGPPMPELVPHRTSGATMKTAAGESSFDQADLARTNEDVASDAGPTLDDTASGEPTETETPAGTASAPFDRHDIPEEQPLGSGASAIVQEFAAESDLTDSMPADGTSVCPVAYPIKGNGRSGIYHLPGAFAYERTVPSICFRTAEAAERAGFRAARH